MNEQLDSDSHFARRGDPPPWSKRTHVRTVRGEPPATPEADWGGKGRPPCSATRGTSRSTLVGTSKGYERLGVAPRSSRAEGNLDVEAWDAGRRGVRLFQARAGMSTVKAKEFGFSSKAIDPRRQHARQPRGASDVGHPVIRHPLCPSDMFPRERGQPDSFADISAVGATG